LHLLEATSRHAGGDGPSARLAPAGITPICFCQLSEQHRLEAERPRRDIARYIHGAIALEHEDHQPAFFGIMPLPATFVAGGFHFNSFYPVLESVLLIAPLRKQVGMAVVEGVLGKRRTILGDRAGHKLTDDSAETRRHDHRLETPKA